MSIANPVRYEQETAFDANLREIVTGDQIQYSPNTSEPQSTAHQPFPLFAADFDEFNLPRAIDALLTDQQIAFNACFKAFTLAAIDHCGAHREPPTLLRNSEERGETTDLQYYSNFIDGYRNDQQAIRHYRWSKTQQQQLADSQLQGKTLTAIHQRLWQLKERSNTLPTPSENSEQLSELKQQLTIVFNMIRQQLSENNHAIPEIINEHLDSIADQLLDQQHAPSLTNLLAIIQQLQALPQKGKWWELLQAAPSDTLQHWLIRRYAHWQQHANYAHYTGRALHVVAYELLPKIEHQLAVAKATLSNHQETLQQHCPDFYQQYTQYLQRLDYHIEQEKNALLHAILSCCHIASRYAPNHGTDYCDDLIVALLDECQQYQLIVAEWSNPPQRRYHLSATIKDGLERYLKDQQCVQLTPFSDRFEAVTMNENTIFLPNWITFHLMEPPAWKNLWQRFLETILSSTEQAAITLFLTKQGPLTEKIKQVNEQPACLHTDPTAHQDHISTLVQLSETIAQSYQQSQQQLATLSWWQYRQKALHEEWQCLLVDYQKIVLARQLDIFCDMANHLRRNPGSFNQLIVATPGKLHFLASEIATQAIHCPLDRIQQRHFDSAQRQLWQRPMYRSDKIADGFSKPVIHHQAQLVPNALLTLLKDATIPKREKEQIRQFLQKHRYLILQMARLASLPIGIDNYDETISTQPIVLRLQNLEKALVKEKTAKALATINLFSIVPHWQSLLDSALLQLRIKKIELWLAIGQQRIDSGNILSPLPEVIRRFVVDCINDIESSDRCQLSLRHRNQLIEAKSMLDQENEYQIEEKDIRYVISQLTQHKLVSNDELVTLLNQYNYLYYLSGHEHPAKQEMLENFRNECEPALNVLYKNLNDYLKYLHQSCTTTVRSDKTPSEYCWVQVLQCAGTDVLRRKPSALLQRQLCHYIALVITQPQVPTQQQGIQFIAELNRLSDESLEQIIEQLQAINPHQPAYQQHCQHIYLQLVKTRIDEGDPDEIAKIQATVLYITEKTGADKQTMMKIRQHLVTMDVLKQLYKEIKC